MTENDQKSQRGRPPSKIALKPWGAYVEIALRHRLGAPGRSKELFQTLHRMAPSTVHGTIDTFRLVLAGKRPALNGFAAALTKALGLNERGVGAEAFDLPLEDFERLLAQSAPSEFETALKALADGTVLRLRAPNRTDPVMGHMGRAIAPITVLTPNVQHRLEIDRPLAARGVAGPLMILGYGYDDKTWQLVSAVADPPLPLSRTVPWGALTGVSMTPTPQRGRFALHVVGSNAAFEPSLAALYDKHIGGDGYLSGQELLFVQHAVTENPLSVWAASLSYTIAG